MREREKPRRWEQCLLLHVRWQGREKQGRVHGEEVERSGRTVKKGRKGAVLAESRVESGNLMNRNRTGGAASPPVYG